MKPGDRVIWLGSPGRSFLTGWRVEKISGVVIGRCMHRVRVKIKLSGGEKTVVVEPDNLMPVQEQNHEDVSFDSPKQKDQNDQNS